MWNMVNRAGAICIAWSIFGCRLPSSATDVISVAEVLLLGFGVLLFAARWLPRPCPMRFATSSATVDVRLLSELREILGGVTVSWRAVLEWPKQIAFGVWRGSRALSVVTQCVPMDARCGH